MFDCEFDCGTKTPGSMSGGLHLKSDQSDGNERCDTLCVLKVGCEEN